jgi:hypothetical protein
MLAAPPEWRTFASPDQAAIGYIGLRAGILHVHRTVHHHWCDGRMAAGIDRSAGMATSATHVAGMRKRGETVKSGYGVPWADEECRRYRSLAS